MKYTEVHLANSFKFVNYAYNILKPLVGQALKERLFFHTTMESLHKRVDKSVLTEELGGTLGPANCKPSLDAALEFDKSDNNRQLDKFLYPE